MPNTSRTAALLFLLCLAGACRAQTVTAAGAVPAAAATPAQTSAQASAPASAPAAAPPQARAANGKRVIEDDNVRIEETRLRGQTRRIQVQSKQPLGSNYDVTLPAGGKDPSRDRGGAGQPAWSVFSF